MASEARASCCSTSAGDNAAGGAGPADTREEFLREKAANFLALPERHGPSDELRAVMAQYKPEAVLTTVLTVLQLIKASGRLAELAPQVVRRQEKVEEAERPVLEARRARYLDCFLSALD